MAQQKNGATDYSTITLPPLVFVYVWHKFIYILSDVLHFRQVGWVYTYIDGFRFCYVFCMIWMGSLFLFFVSSLLLILTAVLAIFYSFVYSSLFSHFSFLFGVGVQTRDGGLPAFLSFCFFLIAFCFNNVRCCNYWYRTQQREWANKRKGAKKRKKSSQEGFFSDRF